MSRGGSINTATYVAAIIGAASVIIWRDVPGVLSLDPSWGMRGRRIPYLNYREAVEIASTHLGYYILMQLSHWLNQVFQ